MKKYDIPVGIGVHQLEPIAFCEKEGLVPDFYIKTLHDNLFCNNHEETVAFMQDVKVPWIAFKVLAAGAVEAEEGFKFAFEKVVQTSFV